MSGTAPAIIARDRTAPIGASGLSGRNARIVRIDRNGRNVPSGRITRSPGGEADMNAKRFASRGRDLRGPAPRLLFGTLLLLLLGPAPGMAQTDHWQIGTAPSFSSGKYGTDERTEVLHTPITARRLFKDGDLSFVFPITCIRGTGGVTVVNGTPVRTEQTRTGSTGGRTTGSDTTGRTGSAGTSRTTTDTAVSTGTTPATPLTTCGMGDVIVRGRYYLIDQRSWLPTIAIRGHVKAPTASDERGLGT